MFLTKLQKVPSKKIFIRSNPKHLDIKRFSSNPSMSHSIYSVKKTDCFEVMVPTYAAPSATTVPPFPILLTSEHASQRIPPDVEDWPEEDKWLIGTHWSYDPGAEEITRDLLSSLNAKAALLHRVSRLILDPNRPTDSDTLIRTIAEGKSIKYNTDISEQVKEERIKKYHTPYHAELRYLVNLIKPSLVLSLHSYTPNYEGNKRDIEVGILYNMHEAPANSSEGYDARINEPWSGKEGFMHAVSTVQTAKSRKGLMLEFRNDLLLNEEWRKKMVTHLTNFLVKNPQLFQ